MTWSSSSASWSRRHLCPADLSFDEISLATVDENLIRSITLADLYAFITFLSVERKTARPSEPGALHRSGLFSAI